MSPSEAENSSISTTFGPSCMSRGLGLGVALRTFWTSTSSRASRSMIIGDTLPPPFPRSSMISAFFESWG